jgi:hypothetical protein
MRSISHRISHITIYIYIYITVTADEQHLNHDYSHSRIDFESNTP